MSTCGIDDDIPQGERKTVTDFCYLLDKSKQLFNGLRSVTSKPMILRSIRHGKVNITEASLSTSLQLSLLLFSLMDKLRFYFIFNLLSYRDLPQYGQKQWQSYFGRTFDVYTKLWKFQQQHRLTCAFLFRSPMKTSPGQSVRPEALADWGDRLQDWAALLPLLVSSHSLRTSETSYLNEAFSFYSAIRQRSYYSQVNKEDRPELVVKKLRYYARFIVVCLLLNKMTVVKELVKELSDEIEDYTHRFNTEDQVEWNLVLQEVAAFIEADPVMVLNDDNTLVILSNRLSETGAPLLEQGMIVGQLTLADALIIGNCNNQVKFSELTVDMFRMLQALEREPMNLATQMNKPGLQATEELPANSVLLIYLSATGVFPSGRLDSEGTNKGMLPFVNRL
ncbi:hypothetical protein Chor_002054 [Crotalus horridus]